MLSKDAVIEQLLMLHQSLIRIAYNAGDGSNEVLEELARIKRLKDTLMDNYEK